MNFSQLEMFENRDREICFYWPLPQMKKVEPQSLPKPKSKGTKSFFERPDDFQFLYLFKIGTDWGGLRKVQQKTFRWIVENQACIGPAIMHAIGSTETHQQFSEDEHAEAFADGHFEIPVVPTNDLVGLEIKVRFFVLSPTDEAFGVVIPGLKKSDALGIHFKREKMICVGPEEAAYC